MNKFGSPDPNNAPCKILMHSGQWFMRRRFFKFFAIYKPI